MAKQIEYTSGKKYNVRISRTIIHRVGVVFYPNAIHTWDGSIVNQYKDSIISAIEVVADGKSTS